MWEILRWQWFAARNTDTRTTGTGGHLINVALQERCPQPELVRLPGLVRVRSPAADTLCAWKRMKRLVQRRGGKAGRLLARAA